MASAAASSSVPKRPIGQYQSLVQRSRVAIEGAALARRVDRAEEHRVGPHFIHPPRDNFAQTMTDEERAVWSVHFERFRRLLAQGVVILVGPTLGTVNTGIAIIEAPDEAAARKLMEEDPVIAGGYARGELRPFRVSLLRGRD